MVPPEGNGRLDNPDRSELCEDIDWLTVLGGRPATDQGKKLISDHEAVCTWCARLGRHQGLSSTMLDLTPEVRARAESIFGPITWD